MGFHGFTGIITNGVRFVCLGKRSESYSVQHGNRCNLCRRGYGRPNRCSSLFKSKEPGVAWSNVLDAAANSQTMCAIACPAVRSYRHKEQGTCPDPLA